MDFKFTLTKAFFLLSIFIINYELIAQNQFTLDSLTENKNNIYPQSIDDGTEWREYSQLSYWRLSTVFALTITADIIGINHLKETWYNEPRGKFHAQNFSYDMRKWQQMDKIGHAVHAFYASNLFSKAYRWSGLSANQSIWYGSLAGWFWMMQIEFTDGFFESWGFSWGDVIGNTVGAGFSALRQFYPDQLKGIRFKVSYHESNAYKEDRYIRSNISQIDDYEGITFWLALNVYDLLPSHAQDSFPVWLKPFGIAIGQSTRGVAGSVFEGSRELYLSLDFDITKIPLGYLDRYATIRYIKDELNFIKLPMPTIRITPETTWFGLYF